MTESGKRNRSGVSLGIIVDSRKCAAVMRVPGGTVQPIESLTVNDETKQEEEREPKGAIYEVANQQRKPLVGMETLQTGLLSNPRIAASTQSDSRLEHSTSTSLGKYLLQLLLKAIRDSNTQRPRA
ncbi:hypothetical protein QE152_g21888 [Popillia japonica]|uniref:Uncharacterized protein n=1 Tax=Popillia japonica TaxID=7064 RepID=A0AAW1KMU8_POPJA